MNFIGFEMHLQDIDHLIVPDSRTKTLDSAYKIGSRQAENI